MDNISQFPNTNEEKGSALKRVNKRVRARNVSALYKALIVLLIIAGGLTAYFIYEKTKIFETYDVASSIPRVSSENVKITDFNGNLLTYSKDGASSMTPDGKLLWNRMFDMQNPMISICGDTVAFADYGGSTVLVQNEDGTEGSIETDMPIRKIAVSSGGYVAAVLEDSDVTWIFMYDMNGTEIAKFRTTMEKSGYPVDIDVSPNGELVVVSFFYLDYNEVKSKVAFYNFGAVGQNQIDNLVSAYNYSDTLVPTVRFLNSEIAYSLSENRLCIYSGNHIPVSISDMFITDEILSVYNTEKNVGIIYRNTAGETKYRFELYDSSGKCVLNIPFDFDYSGVSFGYDSVVIYGDTNVLISNYSGEIRYQGNYEEPVLLAMPTQVPSKFVFVTEKTVDISEFD